MARAALLLVVLLLAACASRADGGSPAVDVVGEWELVSGTTAGQPLAQPADTRATLTFDGDQVGGRSFCNHYSAGYTLDGDAVRFEQLGGTEMGCDPDVMAAETAFLTALGAVTRVAIDGEDLVLTGDGVELRFRPIPAVPTSELVGTDWVLESLIDGETASSVAGAPAPLRLDADGTVSGSTGCRTLTGTWEAQGGTVVFPDLRADGECPVELRAQDDHVVAVLGDGFRAEVVEDRLTVTDRGARGLVYRDEGSGPATELQPSSDDLAGMWVMRSGTFEGAEIRIPDQARGTIEFEDGRVSGTAFCNGFGGTYRLDGERLALGDIASTLIGCAGDVGAAEVAFHGVLNASGLSLAVDESELVLTSDAGELRFVRVPPVPVADLVGTRWILETVVRDGTATQAVGSLELRADGTVTFTTQCPTVHGTWTSRGDTVRLADLAHEPIPCPSDGTEREQLVTETLSGGFQPLIEGDVLTVTSLDTQGAPGVTLVYRAR